MEEAVKLTREKELEDLLNPDGMLNRNIYVAVMKIRNAATAKEVENGCGQLDDAINKYMQCAIELDRIRRSK